MFAWSQTRCNLTGWYGMGSGLAAAQSVEDLRTAYREWPLFTALIDNAEMSLAKTDRVVAQRYLALGDRPDITERILDELDLATSQVLGVTRVDPAARGAPDPGRRGRPAQPLRRRAVAPAAAGAARASARRVPATPHEERRLRGLLLLSVNGVAAGLQNTG